MLESPSTRRSFLRHGSIAGAVLLAPVGLAQQKPEEKEKGEKENQDQKISPAEDLMREHGVLNRILLIYDEHLRMLSEKKRFDGSILASAADIVRHFVEEYHEKLEEEHLFPRFRKAGKLVDLVDTLQKQHQAGRRVTDRVFATAASLKTQDDRNRLAVDLEAFNRMYAPHEAREDTVLFPALHKIVSSHEYDALGEQFDKIERQTFGGDGFDIYVDKVAALEKRLGIYDLSKFTPA